MFDMNDDDFIMSEAALYLPSISECLRGFFSGIAQSHARYKLEKRATQAGYNNVDKYILACRSARRYLECVNEHGVGSKFCKRDKERWVELKTVHNGNKVAWNEEAVHKMLEEDAIQAGYEEGYFVKKDPVFLEHLTSEYEECIAKHGVGAEDTLCRLHKKVWLDVKAFQNAYFQRNQEVD